MIFPLYNRNVIFMCETEFGFLKKFLKVSYNTTVEAYLLIAGWCNTFSAFLSYYNIRLCNKPCANKSLPLRSYLLRRHSVVFLAKRISFRKVISKRINII